jgi:hypothetical protein
MQASAALFLLATTFLPPGPPALVSQERGEVFPQEPGEYLTVYLMTVGQGDAVWERFGHNALVFRDDRSGEETAYHWGVFDFDQVDFIPRLARGTMLYSMAGRPLGTTLGEYRYTGRSAWIQELGLTPAQRWELLRRVKENDLPENRDYRYDYYRDNCSTRVRDHLDAVLGGELRHRFSAENTPHSFRWHTRRILQTMPAYYLGIQFVLGPNGDRPISVWEEMFLPRTLRESIRDVQMPDGRGGIRPLVSAERQILDSGRPPPPSEVPFALPVFLLVGLFWGGAFLWLVGGEAPPAVLRRLGIMVLGGTWSLLAGVGGSVLLAAWIFTDHYFWYANYNLFQTNPLFLPLALVFPVFLFTGKVPRWSRTLAVVLGVAAVVGLVLELVPGLGQRNAEILALTVPLNLALWRGLVGLHDRETGVDGGPTRESG